ncbi:MAG: NAD(P)/FAD-dependent oxidoreductase [Shimia sp.]
MVDLTIRGAGVIGLCCAWAGLKRGARVRIVDPYGPGTGASGGVVGALAPHVPENWNAKKAFQLESLLLSRTLWPEVEDASGLSTGYAAAGRLQPIADDAGLALAQARAEGARALWGDAATWEVVRNVGPWAPPSPTGAWIKDTLSAHLHPARSCDALATACRARGAEIVNEAEDAGPTIWATGVAGLTALGDDLRRPIGDAQKGQAAVLDCDRRGLPQLFAEGVHVIPHRDGTVAVGSTSERDWAHPGPDDQLDALVAKARALVPDLGDAPVIQRWAGLRPRARSRAPLMGWWPGRPGHAIANGGFKIGFGMAPLMAEVMADLVLEGRDRIPEDFRLAAP